MGPNHFLNPIYFKGIDSRDTDGLCILLAAVTWSFFIITLNFMNFYAPALIASRAVLIL
jgi:hypothetical protein